MTKSNPALAFAALSIIGLAGCAVAPPSGPTVNVMPGPGISFPKFQQDDNYCRSYASQRVGPSAGQSATGSAATTAVGGTLLGTAAGALLGAAAGNAGMGAAIGAGSGLLLGGGAAALGEHGAGNNLQTAYNTAYAQCMVGYGNTLNGPP